MIHSMTEHSTWGWATLLICTRLKMGIVEKFERETQLSSPVGGIRSFSVAFPGASLDCCPLFFTAPLLPCSRAAAGTVCKQQIPSSKSLVSSFCCGSLPSPPATPLQHCHSVAAEGMSTGMDTNVHLAACTAGRAALSVMGSGQENVFYRLV